MKDSKFYYVNDRPFVRVTQVLSVLDRPGLDRWRGSVGNDEAEVRRDQAADIGTEVHGLIHTINKGIAIRNGDWIMLADEIKNCLRAYQQAQAKLKFKPVQSELFLVGDGYAGTTDCLAKIGKELWLLDWKTGTIRDPQTKEVYPEIHYQLAAYYKACKENLAGCMVAHLNRDTGIFNGNDTFTITQPRIDQAYECFRGLLTVWNYQEGK